MIAAAKRWGTPAPVRLVPGERLIWVVGPCWRSLACRVFHLRIAAGYFVVLVLADMVEARLQHLGTLGALAAAIPGALTGIASLFILAALAFGMARTTRYTLTSHRLVMQFGLALPATLMLPLHRVASAAVRVRTDHTGDVTLRLWPGERIGFAKLWPHARPWRFNAPEPMLRDIPEAAVVVAPLCRALAAATAERQRAEQAQAPLALAS